MLDLRMLRAFVAIADTGSFTAAAERLNVTQSTISQQLARLEDMAGHPLVDRIARPVQPTVSGERLLSYARRILILQDEAEATLADPVGMTSIRIGVPEVIVNGEMAAIFGSFARTHRSIRLDVTAGLSRDLAKRYRAGEFDIIVVKEPVAGSDCRATFQEAMGWFENADAPGEWLDPIPLVTFPPGALYRESMFERIEREGRRWYVAFSGSSLHTVLAGVESGLGLSLLPIGSTSDRHVRLYAPFGVEPSMMVSIYAWEKTGPVSQLVERMIAALAVRFNDPRRG